MMNINLLTFRRFTSLSKKDYSYYEIVFEWEDIILNSLNINLKQFNKAMEFKNYFYKYLKKFLKINYFRYSNKKKYTIYFEMTARKYDSFYNRKGYIPCIIDYFLAEKDYKYFVEAYRNCEMLLISNREVYNYLSSREFPVKMFHFPLSLSEKWIFESSVKFQKKYDIILAGRQNPVLLEWLVQYIEKHKDIRIIVTKKQVADQLEKCVPVKLCKLENDTREGFMEALKLCRILLYATPGMDGGENRTRGWNQVTPRFLEGIAAQCHIIGRYPNNEDTEWYELDKIAYRVERYEQFEERMDYARLHEIDVEKYNEYLLKHSTGRRVELLHEILTINNIIL